MSEPQIDDGKHETGAQGAAGQGGVGVKSPFAGGASSLGFNEEMPDCVKKTMRYSDSCALCR